MDSAMHSLCQAMEQASPLWQQAVYGLGWSHAALVGVYVLAAWLCFLNLQLEKEVDGTCTLWWAATVLLCLLGANVVLQADVLVTQTLRALARLQGWYDQRRVWQYLLIGLMALAVPFVLNSKIWRLHGFRANAQTSTGALSAGLLALLMLFAVRLVSAHDTDAVLNVRLLGVPIGRLLELAFLAWVMWGAACSRRRPLINPKSHPQGIDPHVRTD